MTTPTLSPSAGSAETPTVLTVEQHSAALNWIAGSDVGVSSKAIWSRMMTGAVNDANSWHGNYPHDPSDFGRCHRLLQLVPAWRLRIGEMAACSVEWASLAAHWEELTSLYEAALAAGAQESLELYGRLKELARGSRACIKCGATDLDGFARRDDGIWCLDCAFKITVTVRP